MDLKFKPTKPSLLGFIRMTAPSAARIPHDAPEPSPFGLVGLMYKSQLIIFMAIFLI